MPGQRSRIALAVSAGSCQCAEMDRSRFGHWEADDVAMASVAIVCDRGGGARRRLRFSDDERPKGARAANSICGAPTRGWDIFGRRHCRQQSPQPSARDGPGWPATGVRRDTRRRPTSCVDTLSRQRGRACARRHGGSRTSLLVSRRQIHRIFCRRKAENDPGRRRSGSSALRRRESAWRRLER